MLSDSTEMLSRINQFVVANQPICVRLSTNMLHLGT